MEKAIDQFEQKDKLDYFLTQIAKDKNLKSKFDTIQKKMDRINSIGLRTSILDNSSRLSKENKKKYNKYKKMELINKANSIEEIFNTVIPEIAKDIADLENHKQDFINKLKIIKKNKLDVFNSPVENEILEPFITYEIEDTILSDFNICAIDGSFIHESFFNLDISLFRAIAVIYSFDSKGKTKISYFPDINGIDNYKLSKFLKNFSDEKVNTHISLDRTLMEIKLANKILTESNININIIILDGSILTEPLNLIFSQDEDLLELYFKVIKEYRKLYTLCDQKEVFLVGVIKDSRSSTFRKLLARRLPKLLKLYSELSSIYSINYRTLLSYFSDIDFFNRILEQGERSCVFSINSAGSSWLPRQLELLKHELEDEGIFINNFEFFASYIKPVQYDHPMRVEFCLNQRLVTKNKIHRYITIISAILYKISRVTPDFALPIPQIEAHLRCKLDNNDKKRILNVLKRKISYELANYLREFELKQIAGDFNINEFKIDPLMLKFDLLVSKKRERFPF
ncbi:MAG: DNA double-strand break repair nuclease NurA [Promethearchaeota archaeon]